MLFKLPNEIVIEIARKLQFKDKLVLAVTCQALYHLISSRCLYEKVVMTGTQEESEYILAKFKENQIDGRQVKELWYHLTLLSDDVYVQFPHVFPNTTRYIDISPEHIKQTRIGSPTSQLEKWKDTLEYYSSLDDWFKVASLLQSHTFSRLRFLHLSCFPQTSRRIEFHRCIQNVPSLKELHLDNCVITIDFLETVHTSCIQLHTLKIKDALYLIDNGSLPPDISPIRQLQNLEISGLASFSDQNCVFLDYIVAKYTSLKKLVFYPLPVDGTDVLAVCYPDEFKYQGLLGLVEVDYRNNSRITTLIKKITLTHRLYRSEAARLLSNLPHTIKNLEINGDMFDCVPEALEQGPPRLTDLIIQQRVDSLPVFTNASQLGCFKKLTLLKNLEMHLSPSIQIYNEGFASLSTVCLKTFIVQKSDYSDINLGWILAAFPLLEQLEIYAFKNAFFIKEEKSQPIYLKLKKLSISTSMIDPRFLNLLGILAPNINELSLHISDEDILNISKQQKLSMAIRTMFSKIDYVWDLTAFDLHVFHLFFTKQANQDLFQTTSVYFTIQIGQESKSLVYHHGRGSVPIDTYSKKKIAELPKVTLLCNKVRKIIFNDCTEIVSIESGITIVEKPFLYNNIVFCSLEL